MEKIVRGEQEDEEGRINRGEEGEEGRNEMRGRRRQR